MEKMLSYWTVLGADFVILQAAPPIINGRDASREKNIKRLVHFYESLGFDKMDVNDDQSEPIMIMHLL